MKVLLFLSLIFISITFNSCKKGEVPDANTRYIGTWKNTSHKDDSFVIIIRPDGKAEYHEKSTSGGKSNFKDILGYVFFDGYDFKIGAKNFGNVKFKTNALPERVTITVTPYTYYYIATFNNVEYINDGK